MSAYGYATQCFRMERMGRSIIGTVRGFPLFVLYPLRPVTVRSKPFSRPTPSQGRDATSPLRPVGGKPTARGDYSHTMGYSVLEHASSGR